MNDVLAFARRLNKDRELSGRSDCPFWVVQRRTSKQPVITVLQMQYLMSNGREKWTEIAFVSFWI